MILRILCYAFSSDNAILSSEPKSEMLRLDLDAGTYSLEPAFDLGILDKAIEIFWTPIIRAQSSKQSI